METNVLRTGSGAVDLWDAIEQASPEIALAVRQNPMLQPSGHYDDFPGFKAWLITELALNSPARLIKDKLGAIRDDQVEEGSRPWPVLSKTQIDGARRDLALEWRPVRARIEGSIEQVGVIRKQTRLMALVNLAEELRDRMYDERNEKTGQLYLQHDYLVVLRQIAEEMGDLGAPPGDTTGGLLEIAKSLADIVKVQGSGIQERRVTVEQYEQETPITPENGA